MTSSAGNQPHFLRLAENDKQEQWQLSSAYWQVGRKALRFCRKLLPVQFMLEQKLVTRSFPQMNECTGIKTDQAVQIIETYREILLHTWTHFNAILQLPRYSSNEMFDKFLQLSAGNHAKSVIDLV